MAALARSDGPLRRRGAAIGALLLVAAVGCASTESARGGDTPSTSPPPTLEENLNELVESAFVRQALREAPDIVGDGVRRIGSDLPMHPVRRRRIPGALRDNLNERRLVAALKARLVEEMDAEDIVAMADGLRSHPIRRLNRLSLMANKAPPDELFRYLEHLEQHPPSDARLDAIRRLERSYAGAQLTVAMVAAPLVSVREILATSVRTEEEADMVRAMHRAALAEIGLERMTSEVVAAALIFAYREVSDEDLIAFASFLESDLGGLYHHTMVRLYFEVLEERTKAAARDIRVGTEAPPADVYSL
jgi:hypothetical protein